jgi:hypothetical protein
VKSEIITKQPFLLLATEVETNLRRNVREVLFEIREKDKGYRN